MDGQERKIQKLENERRAIIERMDLELHGKISFLDGCKQTLLSIRTDEDQQDKIKNRVADVETLINKEVFETRKRYEIQLKPIVSDLVGCYLSIGKEE